MQSDLGKGGDEIASERNVSLEASHSKIRSSPKKSDASQHTQPSSLALSVKPPHFKLYIGNLSSSVNANDIRELFEKQGRVTEVDVDVRGFALVMMPDPEEAERAIEALNDHTVAGRRILVEKKFRKTQPSSVVKRVFRGVVGGRNDHPIELFVSQVSNVSEERLKLAFERFGDVVAVTKPRLKPDIAFIIMENFFEARKVRSRRRFSGASSVGPRFRTLSRDSALAKPVRNDSLSEISDDESAKDAESKRKIDLKALSLQRRIQSYLLSKQMKTEVDSASSTSGTDACLTRLEKIRELEKFEHQLRGIEQRKNYAAISFHATTLSAERRDTNLWTWRRPRQQEQDLQQQQMHQNQLDGECPSSKRSSEMTVCGSSPKRLTVEAKESTTSSKGEASSIRRHYASVFSAAARITAAKSLPPILLKKQKPIL